jgi:hypothetical protein
MQKLKGIPMEELVEGGKLKRADILVTRSKRSLLGKLIRFGTESYWNHALMIYVIKSTNLGYETTFIIESGGGGIDIHNISHYFEKLKKYDIGIKRLEADWFQKDVKEQGLYCRRKVRGFALQEIDKKYDYRLIVGIAYRLIRQLILATLFIQRLRKKPLEQRRIRVGWLGRKVGAYICSGFVQWSYYKAVEKLIDEGRLDKSMIQEVILNPQLAGTISEEDLLATTPADLARSDKLSWKYIVKDGEVWEVANDEEVSSIIYPKNRH